jgi:hypothetical protein
VSRKWRTFSRQCRAGHARTLGSYPSTLGEIDPLGFAKLDWGIGTRRLWGKLPPQSSLTLVRFFGLSIAARIVDLTVVRRAKNHRRFSAVSVKN